MKPNYKLIFLVFFIFVLKFNKLYSQCGTNETSVSLTIDFQLDNYPDEDGWQLFNMSTGSLVDSACFGTYDSSNVVSKTFCLPVNDTFKLMVLDDYGDGTDGSIYSLDYTYGNNITIIDTANLNIPYTHCGGVYNSSSIVDTVVFTTVYVAPPSCLTPTNLHAISLQDRSATLSWTENDTAKKWQLEYGTQGFSQGNGNYLITDSIPTSINNLSPSTSYEFYVRSICKVGDSSSWAGPFQFTTACVAGTNFPYFEGFNGSYNCWTQRLISSTVKWKLINAGSGDISSSQEGFGFVEKDYLESNVLLISPPFDFNSLGSDAQIKLWLHRHEKAYSDDRYIIYVNNKDNLQDADTLLSIYSKTTTSPSVPTTGWYEYIESIPNKYNNDSIVYIIIQGITERDLFSYDLGVDAFTLEEIPSCRPTALLSASNITNNSADLEWTERGNALIWEVEYDTSNFNLGSGNSIITTSNPSNISGLSANTAYDFYVRAICGIADSSTWSGPFSFITDCNSITSFPYLENFDDTSLTSSWGCWEILNLDGGKSWRQGNQYLSPSYSAPFSAQGMGNNNDHLISPLLDLPADPMMLKLWDRVEHQNFNNIYSILVSTTGKDSADFTDTLATFNVTNTNWTQRKIYLSAYANQQIYISIYQTYSAADYYGFGIDNFLIDSMPTCVEPSNAYISHLSNDSASFNWRENGTSIQWEVEYGSQNFNLGSGTRLIVDTNYKRIGGLNTSSNYSFYVRSICDIGDSSIWAGPFNFRTSCLPTAAPFSEDFENAGNIPSCWSQATDNIDRWWFAESIFGNSHIGNNGSYKSNSLSSKFFAFVDDSPPHSINTSLLSPFIDISNVNSPVLSFFKINHNEGAGNVDFSVDVWDGNAWQQVYFSDTNSFNGEWEQIVLPLNNLSSLTTTRIRFTVDEVNGKDAFDDFAIDDVFLGDISDFSPYYNVGTINTVDTQGIADSLSVEAFTTGIVAGIDLDSTAGILFTLIDTSSGEMQGIRVKSNSNTNYLVQEGDFIHLRGIIGQTNGMQEILADSIKVLKSNISLPQSILVSLLNENTESILIELRNLRIDSIRQNKLLLSNSSGTYDVKIEENTEVYDSMTFIQGNYICSLKGIGGQMDSTLPYTSNYYISPMYISDILYSPIVNLGNDTSICDTSKFILDAGAGFSSYLWSTGDTTQTLKVSTLRDSTYFVSVSTADGCISIDSINIEIDICTKIAENRNNVYFKITPNPSNGIFNIQATSLKNIHMLEVYDLHGKVILSKQLNISERQWQTTIDMSNQAKGVYFIRLSSANGNMVQKIILK